MVEHTYSSAGKCRNRQLQGSQENTYFALADLTYGATDAAEARKLIEQIRDYFGLQTVAYFGQHINPRKSEEPYLAVTYSDEWINHYIQNNYVQIDPVIEEGFRTVLPLTGENSIARTRKSETCSVSLTNLG